jgi:cyclohexanone monooxygenase
MVDLDANSAAIELYAEQVRRSVREPLTAESLVPDYPMFCKRGILDDRYYDTFNRENVHLVDLRKESISEISSDGIQTSKALYEFDVILFATGFDAMTGALNSIDIRGRNGQALCEVWEAEGPVAYLGLHVAGFPNLFTVTGPGSPSVLTNMVASIEQHVEWIAECLTYLRENGYRSLEATSESQREWVEHAASLASGTIRTACNSWYLGSNVPGKLRVFMPYIGGLSQYREKCDAIAQAGYEGFVIE